MNYVTNMLQWQPTEPQTLLTASLEGHLGYVGLQAMRVSDALGFGSVP